MFHLNVDMSYWPKLPNFGAPELPDLMRGSQMLVTNFHTYNNGDEMAYVGPIPPLLMVFKGYTDPVWAAMEHVPICVK